MNVELDECKRMAVSSLFSKDGTVESNFLLGTFPGYDFVSDSGSCKQ